jgi:hypothetical protein
MTQRRRRSNIYIIVWRSESERKDLFDLLRYEQHYVLNEQEAPISTTSVLNQMQRKTNLLLPL